MSESSSIQLKVISMDEKNFTIAIEIGDTIKDFKVKIEEVCEVPWRLQRLICKGKLLDNDKTIRDCQLKNLDAIHLIAKVHEINDNLNTNLNNNLADDDLFGRAMTSGMRGENGDLNQISFGFLPLFPPLRRRRIREVPLNNSTVDTLASIVQNNYTLESMLDNINFKADFSKSKISRILHYDNLKIDFIDFENREFTIGQWVDVKDTINQWLEAEIIDIDDSCLRRKAEGERNINSERKVKVHYIGWGDNWDEWLTFNSKRIMPFRFFTVEKFKDRLCPSTRYQSNQQTQSVFNNTLTSFNKNKKSTIDSRSLFKTTESEIACPVQEVSLSNILHSMGKDFIILNF